MENSDHYLLDVIDRISTLGLVATLVVREARKVSKQLNHMNNDGQDCYPAVLSVLTELVGKQVDVQTLRLEWFENDQLRRAKANINEAIRRSSNEQTHAR